ncbi:glycosyltransferase family 2 protein [archaeon]|jgi:glycosyltransferase involved in cell wall biosynthesis|nr:glycosyltransferase family 2 protein [archaeon]MBT3451341.1 glycosyltransferase family 2 protein [archaeon]MBT6869343.1 glycosyltransferase family 2 protein [archaeon]MBT7192506.1 glycosyltransferase family 2 protein [archaeon]MBT7380582.1 glycosyltransferase family 2 protein [archaeon]
MVNKGISIIVPIYNEEETIEELVNKLQQQFLSLNIDFEIILIESGSTDQSKKICDELEDKFEQVKVIHEGNKNGYGSGVRLGLDSARYEILTYSDSDLPCDLSYYQKAINLLENNDLVLGFRTGNRENFARWFFSKGYNLLTKILFNLYGIKDVNFTFKLFKKEHYDKIKLHSNGWFIDVELLSELKKLKLKTFQMPIKYVTRQKGNSNVNINCKLINGFLKEIYQYKFNK